MGRFFGRGASGVAGAQMRYFRNILYFMVGFVFAVNLGLAHAGSLPMAKPTNVSGSYGSYATGGSASFTGASFNSGFTSSVGGRPVTVPASWRMASNAGQFAAAAVRGNPAGLVGAAVVAWLLPYGIEWIEGQWQRSETPAPVPFANGGSLFCHGAYRSLNACWAMSIGTTPDKVNNCSAVIGGQVAVTCTYIPNGNTTTFTYSNNVQCPVNTTYNNGFCVGTAQLRPATDADWNTINPANFPDAAAGELAGKGVPLPLQNPQFDPDPLDVPISDPYVDPSTGKRYQDKARITPQPSSPEVADLRLFKQEVDPNGNPVVDPATNEAKSPEKTDSDPCKENPDRVGCMEAGEADDIDVQQQNAGSSINPVSVGGAATCPADKSVTYLGKQLTISMQPVCTMAGMVHPVVIAVAWLLAGYILIGAMRGEG